MTGHIFIEGEVGSKVTVDSVRDDISQYPQATEWMVHFNSGGGDVEEGYAIGSILKNLRKTTAVIGSVCASIATYAAHCCDHILMNPSGDFTIHLPTAKIGGTADDLRKGAERLDRIKNELIARYMTRVSKKGMTREQVSDMIDKETSMSPNEALAMGFVDDVQEKFKAVAKLDINKFKMENTLTREEAKGFFDNVNAKIDSFFAKFFRNAVQVALADGTMATSNAETVEALVGSTLTDAKGAPCAPGEYPTADGYKITVAEGGKVTGYDPMEQEKEVDALKKQVADLTAKLSAKNNEVAEASKAKAKVEAEFKNQFSDLKKELEELKNKTFGDSNPPDLNRKFEDKQQKTYDPMGQLWDAYRTSH